MRHSLRSFSRRAVLQSVGIGTAAHLLPSLRRPAHAAGAGIPKRLVIVYTQHGTLPQFWDPVGVGGAAPTETSFELGELLKPLSPWKNDLILLSGFDFRSHELNNPNPGDAHQQWQGHSLTGIKMQTGTLAGGPSFDQTIVEGLKANNGGAPPTMLPSVHLGASDSGPYTAWGHPFYYGPGRAVPIEHSMGNAFKRLFPSGGVPGNGSDAAGAGVLARRKSALDFAAAEFKRLQPKLSKDDGTKFQNHADSLSDLQSRLQIGKTRTCMTPSSTAASTGRWQSQVEIGTRLAHAALACDLTRVVALHWDEVPNAVSGYAGGSFGTTDAHDLVHKTDSNGALATNPQAIAVMKKYHLTYADRVAGLLKMLKETPESDGKSLLDHTVVLWCGEISSGGHGGANLRWVLAGNCQGALKTGRYLALTDPKRGNFGISSTAPTHQQLFVTLANAMDVNIDTFGDPRSGKGTITKLRG